MARKSLAELVHDPQNPRKHSPRNIGMISDSLQQFGALRGIVIDEDDVIIAGNGVVEAAMQAGLESVEVIDLHDPSTIIAVRATHMTEEQKRRYAVADNRTTDLSEWDEDVLASMIDDDGIDLSDFFFDREMADILGRDAPSEPDEPVSVMKWEVTVVCHSPDDRDEVREILETHGYQVKERRQ